jgi:hypothetical protein
MLLNKIVNISFFFLVLVFVKTTFSQKNIPIEIEWSSPLLISLNNQNILIPQIKNQNFEGNKPNFYWSESINFPSNAILNLINYETEDALVDEVNYLTNQNIRIKDSIEVEYKLTHSGIKSYMVVNLFPFIKQNNIIKRIVHLNFTLQKNENLNEKNGTLKSTALTSVLSSGYWYKIGVKNDGVCKIDKSFLESIGINTANLNPNSINIFGNGEGKLPEINWVERTDDLAKNAIYIAGEGDGVFNDQDYILFYAWGPNRTYLNNINQLVQDKNIYSDYSYYFINIDPSGQPLRISNASYLSTVSTHQISSYSYYDQHELDLISLVKGGQRWYGESFDVNSEQIFNFSIPNIANNDVVFNVSIASNASSISGSSQTYSVNGNVLKSSFLPVGNYSRTELSMAYSNPQENIPLKVSIVRNSPTTQVYLDRITLNARRNLVFNSNQFNFRDLSSFGSGNIGKFTISNMPITGEVWDVTNRHQPIRMQGLFFGNDFSFNSPIDTLKEFVAFDNVVFQVPDKIGLIENQNLHALPQADYLIVTASEFIDQANRLANLHRENGLKVNVVTTQQVYNEFSSGMLDPTAIRDFCKMFYNRSISNSTLMPKYLLLFGDGTYDPKNRVPNNNNFVPTYQVLESENDISAMVTDDYYGFFDPIESMNATDLLDIGIGRLLISDNTIAKQQVDKIEHYMKNGSTIYSGNTANCCGGKSPSNSTFGDWRLKTILIADDEENGYFIDQDTEPNSKYIKKNYSSINLDKLYLDAYTQISNAGGQRYPDVFNAITDRVERGALVVNYVGHGGETGVAEERVITTPQIQRWNNINTLNLMVTATCEFTKFDDPSRVSAGEWVSLNPYGGAIALMTTTRSVFFGVNTITGQKFYENVFSRDVDNKPLTFGQIMMLTKNASGSSDNKRSFTLIGDPALRLALPEKRIVTDSINARNFFTDGVDTIRALSKVTVKGHITDFSSNLISNFNGIIAPTVYDKVKVNRTLGQDSKSPIIDFELQKNAIYKGKASVKNGYFEFSFIVPKDIDYSFGKGKISYYADNDVFDASGVDTNFIVGGIDKNGIVDNIGPEISIHLNNKNFVNGGITDEKPILMVDLFDENGINTVGNGIGHDIIAVLDQNTAKPIVLNEYYVSDLDSYKSGSIQYSFPELEKGRHSLTIKAWDVNANSSQNTIDFIVQDKQDLSLSHVLNYPNPFSSNTQFYFEHNQICNELETQIQIFTVSGRLVKTINQMVLTNGFRSEGIIWNGLDEYGDKLATGVYVYRLKVKTSDGKSEEKTEKLVILK